tara:strand:+ start:775 stop:1443 length:669 start_codon:yes stop_codon:yes gene_type:complete
MISILLATYNGEKYISKSIDSIINQTYTDWELLIGFNGTNDNSKNIVKNYNDKRIRVFDYGLDKGKSKTLNKLLKEVRGEWIAIQDDDDIWLPKKLEIQNKFSKTGKYDVIGSKIFYCNESEIITGQPNLCAEHDEIFSRSMMGDNQIANSSAILKTSIAKKINGWDEKLSGIEDFDFWLRLMKHGAKFMNIKEELVLHRIHKGSNFNTKKYDLKQILEKYN